MRRALRLVGACLVAYAGFSLVRGEPVTELYARSQQHRLAAELERDVRAAAAPRLAQTRTPLGAPIRGVRRGEPLGRILIPRIGLTAIFVEGTRADDLRKGPGHYEMTALPGGGKTVAIAGHRTTYGAYFRHIDDLRRGDVITLRMRYGEYRYVIFAYRIVDDRDWSIIRARRFETLVLSACHPLYSAAQRWVVFARLVRGPTKRQRPARSAAARASASYEAT